MITPQFELSQEEHFLIFLIRAPLAKVADAEIFACGCDFKFHCKPYFLRLKLPGEVEENEKASAKYDFDSGCFTIRLAKVQPGQTFEGLDMLTVMLAPSGRDSAAAPGIEVLQDTYEGAVGGEVQENEDYEEEVSWEIEQEVYTPPDLGISHHKYGFAHTRSDVFAELRGELQECCDVRDPDSVTPEERRRRMEEEEGETFSPDHYLADLYEDDEIQAALTYKAPWQQGDKDLLTEQDKYDMIQLPKKEYVLDKRELCVAYLGLVDLLYAVAYDRRVSLGDENAESSWNVAKLSPMLSWFVGGESLKSVARGCVRRCLVYPLYRQWALATLLLADVATMLRSGRSGVLHWLLWCRKVLQTSDSRSALADLYLTDYCCWVQRASTRTLGALAQDLEQIQLTKDETGLGLTELETEAAELMEQGGKTSSEEAQHATDLEEQIRRLCIQDSSSESEESSEDESETETESESESDCLSSEEEEDEVRTNEDGKDDCRGTQLEKLDRREDAGSSSHQNSLQLLTDRLQGVSIDSGKAQELSDDRSIPHDSNTLISDDFTAAVEMQKASDFLQGDQGDYKTAGCDRGTATERRNGSEQKKPLIVCLDSDDDCEELSSDTTGALGNST